MELKVDMAFKQLLNVIRQLPDDKKLQIKDELNAVSKSKGEGSISDFQKFLLTGPVMDDEQYQTYLETRKQFNQWRMA